MLTILSKTINKYIAKIIRIKFLDLKNKLVINKLQFQISLRLKTLVVTQNSIMNLVKEKNLILEDIIKDSI